MYQIRLEQFQGPFDLLLGLIEKEKLDITEISLAKVTDGFVSYLAKIEETNPQELADFLEIAAKLLLIKSRILILKFEPAEEEVSNLVDRLKIYREYLRASKEVARITFSDKYSFAREKIPFGNLEKFSLDIKISPRDLERNFKNVILGYLNEIKFSRVAVRRKIISLKEKIKELLDFIKKKKKIILNHFISSKGKPEKVAIFLAALELAKKRKILIEQKELFSKITIYYDGVHG